VIGSLSHPSNRPVSLSAVSCVVDIGRVSLLSSVMRPMPILIVSESHPLLISSQN
jgi:hypothetical protein